MTLCRAFGPCLKPDPANMLDFNIPATAAWIRILGKEIHRWSVGEASEDAGQYFGWEKWDKWKKGFEGCWKSEDLHPDLRSVGLWQRQCGKLCVILRGRSYRVISLQVKRKKKPNSSTFPCTH